jgi:hypothetical protein
MEDNGPSTVTCIVAPPGSGASLLAKAVQAAGISLGKPESWVSPLPGSESDTGENSMITDAHLRLLASLQTNGFASSPLAAGWDKEPEVATIRQDLQAFLAWSPFPQPDWAWKSPAGAQLLPLWETLAAESGFRLRLVIPVRNPLEMACSLRRIARLPLQQGLRLWMTSMLAILEATERLPHLFCSYDRFLTHPEDEAHRLLTFLGREPTSAAVAAVAAVPTAGWRHIDPIPEADLPDIGGTWIANLHQHCQQRGADRHAPRPAAPSLAAWRKYATLFQFAKMDMEPRITIATVRFDSGNGFATAPMQAKLLPATAENSFDITVPVPPETQRIGFTPCDNLAFRSRLTLIESETGTHAVIRNNARMKQADWDVFPPTETPLYEIAGPFAEARTIRLCGNLVIHSLAGENS